MMIGAHWIELRQIGILQRILVLGLADARADLDVLLGLTEEADAGTTCVGLAQAADTSVALALRWRRA